METVYEKALLLRNFTYTLSDSSPDVMNRTNGQDCPIILTLT